MDQQSVNKNTISILPELSTYLMSKLIKRLDIIGAVSYIVSFSLLVT